VTATSDDHLEALEALVERAIHPFVAESLDRYVDILTSAGVERGLLGPREADRVWDRHILNCAAIAPLLPADCRVADVGSGAGLPGVVLAIVRPDIDMGLVEPLLRRATFLTEVVAELGLEKRASVRRERAEALTGAAFDVVVARAVAPLDRLAGWTAPMLRSGGTLLAMKGQRAAAELAEHRPALARTGLRDMEIRVLGTSVLADPTTVVVARRG
jgi:16S rRNA (guanine527-N7)-methyltransferase